MDKNTFTLNDQTYSNNNNILLGIINDLMIYNKLLILVMKI